MTGLGLQTSRLNLDLQISDEVPPHRALIDASDAIAASSQFSNVNRDFTSKIPMVLFTTVAPDFDCELSLNNHHAYQTSALLRDYLSLDPRVQTLAVAIRYWAKLCMVDKQAEGTLPAHAFAILLVFFLQQEKKPVLPCLHDHLANRNVENYESERLVFSIWETFAF